MNKTPRGRSFEWAALVAGIAAAALVVTPAAHADVVITVGAQEADVNNGDLTTVVQNPDGIPPYEFSYGAYSVNVAYALGQPPLLLPQDLHSDDENVSTNGTTEQLTLVVSETGITTPTGIATFVSAFTQNILAPGWSVTEQTYLDTANPTTPFQMSTLLGGETFNTADPLGADPTTVDAAAEEDLGSGPYELTAVFIINSNGSGGADSSTIDVYVPEPMSLMLFASGLVGLGAIRRRNNRRPA